MVTEYVYNAFNLQGKGEKLPGGQNNSYRFGNKILKKNDGDNENINFICTILNELNPTEYRVTKPVISIYGNFVEDGFIATYFEEGYHNFHKIKEAIELSKLFHNDIKHYKISCMKDVDTQWAIAMDILFRNRSIPHWVNKEHKELCLSMMTSLQKVNDKLQIIHGDIGGNILFHNTLPPCIIDFSPCIAPAKMAEAIAVVDCVAWVNSDVKSLKLLEPFEKYENYILHAIMFRLLSILCSKNYTKQSFISEYNAYIKIWNSVCNISHNIL